MATGDFWNLDDPTKPWGPFDPDAEIVFPIEVGTWLDGLATTYASHTIIAEAPLECLDAGTHAAGVIPVRMALAAAAEYTAGRKYPFTIRVVGTDDQQDDRTLWLKVKDR